MMHLFFALENRAEIIWSLINKKKILIFIESVFAITFLDLSFVGGRVISSQFLFLEIAWTRFWNWFAIAFFLSLRESNWPKAPSWPCA